MTEHAPGEPRQFKSLTDKPGLWVASCLCGKYTCQPQGTAEATLYQVARHIRGKVGYPPYPVNGWPIVADPER